MGKKKNVDFQKVKLKVGRSLKKNLNVTDTSFKTKKIFLTEQLKSEEIGPTTHRKLSLRELFLRLRHHSTSSRHDALTGLKEMFTDHPEVVISSLSSVIEKVTEMILDKDVNVRRAALKALEAAFKCLTPHQIMPFFPVLKSYLSCATTHILIDIQDESLPFLDILLKHFPDLTTSTCSRILESLLERLAHRPTKMLTKQSRALLLRVNSFLTATIDLYKSKHRNDNVASKKIGHIALLKTQRLDPADGKFHLHQHSIVSCNESILTNEECAVSFMNAVHPLLVEVLTEIKFSSLFHSSGMAKDFSITLELIEYTLNVVTLLEECAKICESKTGSNKTVELFHSHFKFKSILKLMSQFPFKSYQTKYSKMNESSCITLNMLTSGVFITTFPEVNSETELFYSSLVEYISELFTNDAISGVEHTEEVLKILKKLSKTNISSAMSEELLQSLYAMYKKWQVGRKDRDIVMRYIISMALNPESNKFKDTPTFAYWLSSLPMEVVEIANKAPSFLCFHIREAILLALRGSSLYLQALQESRLAIIGIFLTICEKMPNESDLQFQIVELISCIPQLSADSFLALASIIQKSFVPVGPILHLLELLQERFLSRTAPGFEAEIFISFLLSVLLGVLKQDIKSLCMRFCQDAEISTLKDLVPASMAIFSIIPSDEFVWQRHMKLVEKSSDILLLLEDFDNLPSSIDDYLRRISLKLPCLPTHTAASILILQNKLAKKYPVDNAFCSMVVELTFSLLLYSVATLKIVPNCSSQVECALKVVCQFLSEMDVSSGICKIVLARLKVVSEEQLATLCSAWCLLLNFNLFNTDQMLLVHSAFQNIEFQFPAVTEKMWWKELNYLFSAKTHLLSSAA